MSNAADTPAHVLKKSFEVDALARIERISPVTDSVMRKALFAEELLLLGDLSALVSIEVLVCRTLVGDPSAQRVYDGVYWPEVAKEVLGPERLHGLQALAIEQRSYGAHHWLSAHEALGLRAVESALRPPDERPLGVRRADARKARGAQLEKLLSDPDPAVIAHLLDSPQITEAFVLKLASKRPVSAAALLVVLGASRWFARYPVKRALLLNPYLPGPHAHNLMVYLGRRDLEAFSREPTVASGLRAAAARLVKLRERSLEPQ